MIASDPISEKKLIFVLFNMVISLLRMFQFILGSGRCLTRTKHVSYLELPTSTDGFSLFITV